MPIKPSCDNCKKRVGCTLYNKGLPAEYCLDYEPDLELVRSLKWRKRAKL